jgi:ethanolamine utilization microcompartment shell protein EutL
MSELVKRYTASVFFDKRLWQADIQGSLAHADMLAAQGIIGAQDLADIQRGMAQITQEIESGAFEWKLDLEDVHLNIEARLTQLVGDAGIDAASVTAWPPGARGGRPSAARMSSAVAASRAALCAASAESRTRTRSLRRRSA